MSPQQQQRLPIPFSRLRKTGAIGAVMAGALCCSMPLAAQERASISPDGAKPPEEVVTELDPQDIVQDEPSERAIRFEADNLDYDSDADVIIASGNVLLQAVQGRHPGMIVAVRVIVVKIVDPVPGDPAAIVFHDTAGNLLMNQVIQCLDHAQIRA